MLIGELINLLDRFLFDHGNVPVLIERADAILYASRLDRDCFDDTEGWVCVIEGTEEPT